MHARKAICLSATLALCLAALASGQAPKSSATGSGMFKTTGPDGLPVYRTFTINAITHQDNSTSGHIEIQNRETGTTTHIKLNCLYVAGGKVARMTGVVERTTNPDWEGLPVWVKVVDNGEGKNSPPDEITLVWFFFDGAPSCTDTWWDATTSPIQAGNIQVR